MVKLFRVDHERVKKFGLLNLQELQIQKTKFFSVYKF